MTKSTARQPVTAASGTVSSEDAGRAMESLRPLDPPVPPAPAPAPGTPHEWNDEYVGVGGSYVVVDGKRVPADQV